MENKELKEIGLELVDIELLEVLQPKELTPHEIDITRLRQRIQWHKIVIANIISFLIGFLLALLT